MEKTATVTKLKAKPALELPPELNVEVDEFHCVNCNRFLGFVAIVEGTVAICCKRCHVWSVIDNHQVRVDNGDGKCAESNIKVE